MSNLNTETGTENTHETGAETAESNAGVLASLGIKPTSLAFQTFNFAVVVCILWFMILKPLSKKMEERRKIISDSVENAKKIESEMRMAEQKAQNVVDKAKVEANAIIQRGHEAAVEAGELVKSKAREEIELLIKQARKNISIDKEQMQSELKKETAALVVAALKKILGESFDQKKDGEFINKILTSAKIK